MKKFSFVAGLCAVMLGMGGAVKADVVFSNPQVPGSFASSEQFYLSGAQTHTGLAQKFTTSASFNAQLTYDLNLFANVANQAATFTLGIYTDSGSLPGTLVAGSSVSASASNTTTGAFVYSINTAGAVNLASGTTYWIASTGATNTTGNTNVGWGFAGPSYSGQTAENVISGGGTWIPTSTNHNDISSFGVTITSVPEPGTLALGALAGLGGVGGWWSRRKKKVAEVKEEVVA